MNRLYSHTAARSGLSSGSRQVCDRVLRRPHRSRGGRRPEEPDSALDRSLERAVLGLLARRGPSATSCPRDAARPASDCGGDGRRVLLEPVHRAARRLTEAGEARTTSGVFAADRAISASISGGTSAPSEARTGGSAVTCRQPVRKPSHRPAHRTGRNGDVPAHRTASTPASTPTPSSSGPVPRDAGPEADLSGPARSTAPAPPRTPPPGSPTAAPVRPIRPASSTSAPSSPHVASGPASTTSSTRPALPTPRAERPYRLSGARVSHAVAVRTAGARPPGDRRPRPRGAKRRRPVR
ncbi:DUF3253 domain-containing protein [Streptomyces sp. NPDC088745]|uniref:DUF3253 domain-containing protein n=1 Tax=Streptomyces sp. NPDC088745 TaxID=3365884 RepID=UPI00381E0F18